MSYRRSSGQSSPRRYGIAQPWYWVWFQALIPSSSLYEGFLLDAEATTAQIGFVWVALASLVGGIIAVALYDVVFRLGGNSWLFVSDVPRNSSSPLLICAMPVMLTVSLAVSAGIWHWLARLLGGKGTYSGTIYTTAAYWAPTIIIISILLPIPIVNLILVPLGIYGVVLGVIALKTAQQFEWWKALLALWIPSLPAIMCSLITWLL